MNGHEIGEKTIERAKRMVRLQENFSLFSGSVFFRFLGEDVPLWAKKAEEHASKVIQAVTHSTPHAEAFYNEIKNKRSGVIFQRLSKPLTEHERLLALQMLSDTREQVRDSWNAFKKVGTIFSRESDAPPLKHA